jgi:hypothetical protein
MPLMFDLEALVATAEFAAQVTAFIAARRTLSEETWFNDELDLCGAFVTGALHLEAPESMISGQRAVLSDATYPSHRLSSCA